MFIIIIQILLQYLQQQTMATYIYECRLNDTEKNNLYLFVKTCTPETQLWMKTKGFQVLLKKKETSCGLFYDKIWLLLLPPA